jgi:hypothetical protein
MRLDSLIIAVVVSVASGLVTATPISCSDVRSFPTPSSHQTSRICWTALTASLQLKRDLILKGELPPEACCSYGRCQGDVVVAMF